MVLRGSRQCGRCGEVLSGRQCLPSGFGGDRSGDVDKCLVRPVNAEIKYNLL